MADIAAARLIAEALRRHNWQADVTPDSFRAVLSAHLAEILAPVEQPLSVTGEHHPHIILMVGVNGSGKTTTAGKLAARFQTQGKSVMLAAADTFRAAAIEQLAGWNNITGYPVDFQTTKDAHPGSFSPGRGFNLIHIALHEHIGYFAYWLTGRI